jgi:hypothetical protein
VEWEYDLKVASQMVEERNHIWSRKTLGMRTRTQRGASRSNRIVVQGGPKGGGVEGEGGYLPTGRRK